MNRTKAPTPCAPIIARTPGAKASSPTEVLITADELIGRLSITRHQLARMRMAREIPGVVKLGRKTIRYRWSAIDNWLRELEQDAMESRGTVLARNRR